MTWESLAGTIERRIDYRKAAQFPTGIKYGRHAFLVVRGKHWKAAQVPLSDESVVLSWDGDQWAALNASGVTAGSTADSQSSDLGLSAMLEPEWYLPSWGRQITVDRSQLEPSGGLGEVAVFVSLPGIERVRITYDAELGIVEDITSYQGDEEIAWLRLDVIRLA